MPNALSSVAICNMALGRLRVGQTISSLVPVEQSASGIACSSWYDYCRMEVLHDFFWPWASKYAVLTLVATAPNEEWLYAYTYPTDCLFVRRLTITPTALSSLPSGTVPFPTYDRADTNAYPAPFEVGYLNGQQVIYTDMQNASVKYTFDQQDVNCFTPEFANVLAWRLAMEIGPVLRADNGIITEAQKNYERKSLEGAAHAMNEAQNDKPFSYANTATIRGRQRQ